MLIDGSSDFSEEELERLKGLKVTKSFVKNTYETLLNHSVEKTDPVKAFSEWVYTSHNVDVSGNGICDFCGESDLVYLFFIQNSQKELILGSSCIEHFKEISAIRGVVLRDIFGSVVDRPFITKAIKQGRIDRSVDVVSNLQLNPDYKALISRAIKEEVALSPLDLLTFYNVYEGLDYFVKLDMRQCIKVDLRSNAYKDYLVEMQFKKDGRFEKVREFMSHQQKERYPIIP